MYTIDCAQTHRHLARAHTGIAQHKTNKKKTTKRMKKTTRIHTHTPITIATAIAIAAATKIRDPTRKEENIFIAHNWY